MSKIKPKRVERLLEIYPDKIAKFSIESLNTSKGQNDILDFIDYTGIRQKNNACHVNKQRSRARHLFNYGRIKALGLSRVILPQKIRHFLWHHLAIEKLFH